MRTSIPRLRNQRQRSRGTATTAPDTLAVQRHKTAPGGAQSGQLCSPPTPGPALVRSRGAARSAHVSPLQMRRGTWQTPVAIEGELAPRNWSAKPSSGILGEGPRPPALDGGRAIEAISRGPRCGGWRGRYSRGIESASQRTVRSPRARPSASPGTTAPTPLERGQRCCGNKSMVP